jgi:hypothetical protein
MFVFLVFRKSDLIESCSSFEDLSAHKISLPHIDQCKFCIHLRSLNIPPPYSIAPTKKIMIQIKLVGMSMIFHCTKIDLSKCNSSLVVSIKQNFYFYFQLPAMFVFLFFRKSYLIKRCSSSEGLSVYKISWSHVDWCKFCIHLRSLNVHYFGMVEATRLKLMASM